MRTQVQMCLTRSIRLARFAFFVDDLRKHLCRGADHDERIQNPEFEYLPGAHSALFSAVMNIHPLGTLVRIC